MLNKESEKTNPYLIIVVINIRQQCNNVILTYTINTLQVERASKQKHSPWYIEFSLFLFQLFTD